VQSAAQPVRPVSESGQTGLDQPTAAEAVRPVSGTGQTGLTTEAGAEITSTIDTTPPIPPVVEDEELVDFEPSPERDNMEINVVYLSSDYYVVPEEEISHLQLGPRDAVFQKPSESENHLKALYMRGHINGKPISRMLVDGGAIVNLMPYSLYKKIGGKDEELIKTNMTVSGVGGGDPIGAKGVASMELTVGSKTIATAFFVSEVQGNFSLILGRDWIHANKCIPSTLHQYLIQWIGDEVEVVHGDNSSFVATADSDSLSANEKVQCLSGMDLTDYELISCTKDGFVPATLKPMENRLNYLL
jgi:hypothetical protein